MKKKKNLKVTEKKDNYEEERRRLMGEMQESLCSQDDVYEDVKSLRKNN